MGVSNTQCFVYKEYLKRQSNKHSLDCENTHTHIEVKEIQEIY